KALRVLPEAQILKPIGDLLHRRRCPEYRASSARLEFIRETRKAVGEQPARRRRRHLSQNSPGPCMSLRIGGRSAVLRHASPLLVCSDMNCNARPAGWSKMTLGV